MTAQTRAQVEHAIERLQGVEVRIRFVLDSEHEFEECNGERRPLTEAEYKKNAYRACPKHWRAGTKVIRTLKNGRQVQGCATCGNTKYKTIPYAEYLEYYGNPSCHVYIGAIKEERRGCKCGHPQITFCRCFTEIDSVWGIDLMEDDPIWRTLDLGNRYTLAEVRAMSDYLSEVIV